MPIKKIQDFLYDRGVRYLTISHSPAYTAQEVAESAHVRGKDMAKTVIVKIDGTLVMAVLPASLKIGLEHLQSSVGAKTAEIAMESDFADKFPGCMLGAMPPFGNLYGMEVFADEALARDMEIAFNAGSYTELVKMKWKDYEKHVKPKILKFAH